MLSKPKKVSNSQAEQMVWDKVASSGLSESDRETLGICLAEDSRLKELGLYRKVVTMEIPYYDFNHKRLNDFARFRYLQDSRSAMERLTKQKERRYVQPPKTLNRVYCPPLVPWANIVENVEQTICITEGELKAACVSKHVMPCLGLGGVYSFRSRKQGVEIIPELQQIKWAGRKVVIVFDSDAETNQNVINARNALAHGLTGMGAVIFIARIKCPRDGHKLGIDDFLVEYGAKAAKVLLTEQIEPWQFTAELYKFNGEVAYVRQLNKVVNIENGCFMQPAEFEKYAYAPRTILVESVTDKGDLKRKVVPAAAEWIKWPQRREVEKVVYEPGEDRFTTDGNFNTWQGWGCQPYEGDDINVQPWTDLLDHLFKGFPAERKWFEEWCAIPIQQPGVKQFTTAVLWSLQTGNGKSMVGRCLGKIYGDNYTLISDHELEDRRYEWAENKQFVLGDDVTGKDQRKYADRLKMIITQPMMRLDIKYVKSFTVVDHINYLFTSNHPDAFFLEDQDRRFFIFNCNVREKPKEFYDNLVEWLDFKDGGRHLFAHLLQLPIGDRQATDRAPSTLAKEQMISLGKSDLASWIKELRENPDNVLKCGNQVFDGDLWSAEDLLRVYDQDDIGKVSVNGMARELRRAGFEQAYQGRPIRLVKTFSKRLYIVRHITKWTNYALHESMFRDHYLKTVGDDMVKGSKL